jgi:hypothetical protein
MKHLKSYENTKNISTTQFNVGDYVLCQIHNIDSRPNSNRAKENLKDFLENNIGRIIHISTNNYVKVKYQNIYLQFFIQQFFENDSIIIYPYDIIKASPNIVDILKEIEIRQNSKKYNI